MASSGKTEAVILIKAAPQVGQRHGETVCCAGLHLYGAWLRLYPVSFRHLEQRQKFARWERVTFNWRLPIDDSRIESRRVDQETIEIVGHLKPNEREKFLSKSLVTSLQAERLAGRSLALLKPEIIEFVVEAKTSDQLEKERTRFASITDQGDLFAKEVMPHSPCPFLFRYRYRTEDGDQFGTCQDWEIEATYFNWSRRYGEHEAINKMKQTFGVDYPKKGMLLAMGTHSLYPDVWLINGIIRLDEIKQTSLF
jgi:hypothetical protein